MRLRALACALFVLAGCRPQESEPVDAGTVDAGVAVRVSSISPDRGPASGGTFVTVTGSGFTEGARLFVGASEALEVTRISENRLTAKTPPTSIGGEAVSVTVVTADGAEAQLPGGFTYDAAPGLSSATLTTQPPAELTSLDATVTVTLEAEALAPGLTEPAGPASSLRAEVGFGISGSAPADFTWVAAAYVADVDGKERCSGSVALPVVGGEGRLYDLAARFSLDDGMSWTIAAPILTVSVHRPLVGWCKAGGVSTGPETHALMPGATPPDVFAQVFHATLTEAPGPANGLEVELGVGAEGADVGTFTWSPAAFNVQQGNDDEWRAALVPPAAPGPYRYAFRARLLDGPWRACDGDGSDNGFDPAQAGTLTVAPFSCSAVPLLQSSVAGGDSLTVRATTSGSALRMQVGLGSAGSAGWGWSEANETGAGQWARTFTPAYTGNRQLAFRASDDNGTTWWPCPPAQTLDVLATASAAYCNLQYPPTVVKASAAGTTVYGQLYEAGLTEAPGAPSGVTGELGYGPSSEDPGLTWTWLPATWNLQVGNNDEYQAELPPAAALEGMNYAFRFSVPGGTCYGDLDGNGRAFSFSGEAGGSPNLGTVLP